MWKSLKHDYKCSDATVPSLKSLNGLVTKKNISLMKNIKETFFQ